MSFRNPDVELHVTGWPALIIVIGILIALVESVFFLLSKIF